MSYQIKTIESMQEINQGNTAQVNIYNWGGIYRPVTKAKLCFIKDRGFGVKMTCEEQDPRVTVEPPEGFVCVDSCMEFFVNFYPTLEQSPYINFEANAIGAMCCEFGEKGGVRPKLTANGIELPQITPFQKENEWGFELFIPLSLIQSVYHRSDFQISSVIKGNFFKCGDKTKIPHYGIYTKIDMPYPTFHQPQFFAEMEIVE